MNHPFFTDSDPQETQEWLDALASLIKHEGSERAKYILQQLASKANLEGIRLPVTTPYINSIPAEHEKSYPGDHKIEDRISALIRWNAIAMVLRGGKQAPELGGHIATFASSASLYEVGFNHFFHGATDEHLGDLLYIQGHSSPGIYARAYLEGRLTEEQLNHFRQEVNGKGISSYPHPWLMPEFWQFPTVSMGLGPLMAIYQARFLKYLENRGLIKNGERKVWVFLGDGEMDEPESLGAISVAAREGLDNLIFVVNCNLQRLDGPVRGNAKIIQELEGVFYGAGWNVLKVIWGSGWDRLLAADKQGLLQKRMNETVDGEYQNYRAKDGAFIREQFFGVDPTLKALVADMSDEEIWHLRRGGHESIKVYNAYASAVKHKGQPTVILAKTVKGFGMGAAGEGMNITHQQKKMDIEALKAFRDRFQVPISDDDIADAPFFKPASDSPEMRYLQEKRKALGGYLPLRRSNTETLTIPELSTFEPLLKGTAEREISTTMAFVRFLNILMKDQTLGSRVVPIIPDESRTFGMEGMFRQYGIYSAVGQLYKPVDAEQVMYYREEKNGQLLEEGINEGGAFSSWIAASTSYSTNNFSMIPFYIYYSMFGFQRTGDLAWAAADMQAKGFLIGGTAGRTTLAGEGLQHQDGHSHIQAGLIPNCVSYDPTYSYELAVILRDGMRRMYQNNESIYYYITVMNENYTHPDMPEGVEEGIIKGMYLLKSTEGKVRVQLLGSGTILREVIAAADILQQEFDIGADIWSATSFNELGREARKVERYNRLHPENKPLMSYVAQCLENRSGPVIAATDYIQAYADQIRAYISQAYTVLGTDGFGRSDTRKQLRHFFEVDAKYIVAATLKALADQGNFSLKKLASALTKLRIDPEKPDPLTV
ncbi:MAG: Pyruvate dehydrogenase E1 component [Legionellaceae bacterium]